MKKWCMFLVGVALLFVFQGGASADLGQTSVMGGVTDAVSGLPITARGTVTAWHASTKAALGIGIIYGGVYTISVSTATNPTPTILMFHVPGYVVEDMQLNITPNVPQTGKNVRLSTVGSVLILNSPNGIVTTQTPTYSWSAVTGAKGYRLYVDDGTATVRYGTVTANCDSVTCTFTETVKLTNRKNYYWSVQMINAADDSPWAVGKLFTVSIP